MKSRDNPGYDRKTGKSCSDRCAGCSASCKKWKKYVKQRDSEYSKTDTDKLVNNYEISRARRLYKGSGHDFHGE